MLRQSDREAWVVYKFVVLLNKLLKIYTAVNQQLYVADSNSP